MLGPLMPCDEAEMRFWCPGDFSWNEKKLPLTRRLVTEDAIFMGGTMVCIQRGYEPEWFGKQGFLEQVYLLMSVCFHPGGWRSKWMRMNEQHSNIDGYAWDFLLMITDNARTTVLSACFVDLRDTRAEGKLPYLYICDLCTRTDYSHLSLGSQLVHGVQRLRWMMLHADTGWKGSFPKGLCVALNVNPADDTGQHISNMYLRCGFVRAERGGPLDFTGYTPYIPYLFLFESSTFVPMWMPASSGDSCYEDGGMRVFGPDSDKGCEMFHVFPAALLPFVRQYGLVCPNQAKRLFKGVYDADWFRERAGEYTSMGVWFSKARGPVAKGVAVFVIRASAVNGEVCDRLLSRGSVAMHLAVRVEGV